MVGRGHWALDVVWPAGVSVLAVTGVRWQTAGMAGIRMVRRAGRGLAVVSDGAFGGVVIIIIGIIGPTPAGCRWAAAVRAVRAVPVR